MSLLCFSVMETTSVSDGTWNSRATFQLTPRPSAVTMWKQESCDLLGFIFGNLPEMVLTAASVWSDRAGLCEGCWAGQKNGKYPRVLAGRAVTVLNLSASGKWCRSDLGGVCSLASLQPCRETVGEAYGNTSSTFLFGEPTFLHSRVPRYCMCWSCFDVGGAGHFPS